MADESIKYNKRDVKFIESFEFNKNDLTPGHKIYIGQIEEHSKLNLQEYKASLLLIDPGNPTRKVLSNDNVLWECKFFDPAMSGTGTGILNAFNYLFLPSEKTLIIFVSTSWVATSADVKVIVFKYLEDGKLCKSNESIIRINGVKLNSKLTILESGKTVFIIAHNLDSYSKTIVMKSKTDGTIYYSVILRYNDTNNIISECFSPLQILFPYCPSELAALDINFFLDPKNNNFKFFREQFPYKIIVNGKLLNPKDLFNDWVADKCNVYNSSDLNKSLIYDSVKNSILALIERDKFNKQMENSDIKITSKDVIAALAQFCRNNDVVVTDLFKIELSEEELKQKISNDKGIQFNFAVNKWLENNHRHWSECTASETEVASYYESYKWMFMKEFRSDPDYYKLDEIKDKIAQKIKLFKYYRLDDLLTNPPRVEIVWEKVISKNKTATHRGFLDPLPPDELARQKAEFLASQPLELLFSKTEQAELFKEPNYGSINDSYQLAMAYDWCGKFSEAQKAIETAAPTKLAAKFVLGCYYKYGRPGIKPDRTKAAGVFQSIADELSVKSPLSAEESYWMGRSYTELLNGQYAHDCELKEKALKAFEFSNHQDFIPSIFYLQYLNRQNSKFMAADVVKAAEAGDIEAKAFLSGLALAHFPAPEVKPYYKQKSKMLSWLKDAIKHHSSIAQFYLGKLYADNSGWTDAPLKYNKEQATFWLKRAAERGNQDAVRVMKEKHYKN